jgi:hypothetical protein
VGPLQVLGAGSEVAQCLTSFLHFVSLYAGKIRGFVTNSMAVDLREFFTRTELSRSVRRL